jgi:ERCC4-type nuclease
LQHIESGDYVFDQVGIERKTISDLVGSVTGKEKGHNFWNQLKILKDTYKKPLVLIEGFIDWDDRMVSSIVIGITEGFSVPYINSSGHNQSANIIGRIWERYGVARTSKIPPPAVKKGYSNNQITWMMLQTIPHLGGVLAKRIADADPYIFSRYDTKSFYQLETMLNKTQGLNKDSKQYLLRLLGNVPYKRECESNHV